MPIPISGTIIPDSGTIANLRAGLRPEVLALTLVAEGAVEISEFVVYDRRIAEAAHAAGLKVVSPGLK